MNAVTAALTAIAEAFGFIRKRQDLKNAEDVKQAEIKQEVQNEKARITKDVAARDVSATERNLAE